MYIELKRSKYLHEAETLFSASLNNCVRSFFEPFYWLFASRKNCVFSQTQWRVRSELSPSKTLLLISPKFTFIRGESINQPTGAHLEPEFKTGEYYSVYFIYHKFGTASFISANFAPEKSGLFALSANFLWRTRLIYNRRRLFETELNFNR